MTTAGGLLPPCGDVARLVQGFSGGWAMVIGRAVIVDLATGARLVRVLNVIAGVGGVARIVGPLLGAAIVRISFAGRPC
jgi:MFS transporter, DHA1 family, multidrug resistance protein